jgi:glycosyltransferase involved in cell wall biosynthesis
MISILIPTHSRPLLFKRCISSVLSQTTNIQYEILVNNDSCDIEEIYDDRIHIKYFYNKYSDLSLVYKCLFDAAKYPYIFYLEDDDYMLPNFFTHIDFSVDINFCEYVSLPHIQENTQIALRNQKINRKYSLCADAKTFINDADTEYFQLSQLCAFRKSLLNEFPTGNNIENDLLLFKNISKNASSFNYIPKKLWVQTTHGKDNISFDKT